jgi:rhamnogalacturonan acetylesterase
MQLTSSMLSLLALAASTLAAPADVQKRAPTLWLAGDSTMAKANSGALQGTPLFPLPLSHTQTHRHAI